MSSSPEQVKEALQKVDSDKNGSLDFPEFVDLMASLYPNALWQLETDYYKPIARDYPQFSRAETTSFIETFKWFDYDSSNSLEVWELADALKYQGLGKSYEEIKDLLDGKNSLTWVDYVDLLSKLFDSVKSEEMEREFYVHGKNFPGKALFL